MSDAALKPGSTIGILGGGQLGRMLSLAAARLGLKCHIYCPEEGAPARDVAATFTCAPYEDEERLANFARSCDAVTFEFENIPASALAILEKYSVVLPGPESLEQTQDRLIEKNMLVDLGIPVAPFAAVESMDGLQAAIDSVGRPSILKTRRFGYDGKGQLRIDDGTDLGEALAAINHAPAILEGFVPFESEVSVVLTRGSDGALAIYDLAYNIHQNHILKETHVPARVPDAVSVAARDMGAKIAEALDHVGTLAVECFYMGESASEPLLVNEIAPRVHNSGHWTIDACMVSQFENHMRAVASWPLGNPERHSNAVMVNLIGEEAAEWQKLAENGAALHLYGKSDIRPGRKMGHYTKITPLEN